MKRITLAISSLCLGLLSACGTDTGNPGYGTINGSYPVGAVTFANAICSKLTACAGVDNSSCATGVLSATGITSALNLNATTYPTLNSALTATSTGALHYNDLNYGICTDAVSALSCNDSRVTAAYNPGQPLNFNQAYNLLSASSSCQNSIAP